MDSETVGTFDKNTIDMRKKMKSFAEPMWDIKLLFNVSDAPSLSPSLTHDHVHGNAHHLLPLLDLPPGPQGDGQGLLQQQADQSAEGDHQTVYSEGED